MKRERLMTEGEICRSYREAKWPLRQIQVLADLNATKREAIIEILERKGEIMAKKWTDEDNRVLIERANAGATTAELAKEYGTTVGNIYWRISMLRKRGVQGTTDNPDNTDTTLIGAIAQSEADKPTNAAIVDEIEAVENEAVEKLHGETIADKCESCRYNTGDYVCHPHCSGCDGRSKFESAQDKPCRNVYEMARDAITEIERMGGGMVADRIEITAIDNRISAAVRGEECNEVTFSRRLEE